MLSEAGNVRLLVVKLGAIMMIFGVDVALVHESRLRTKWRSCCRSSTHATTPWRAMEKPEETLILLEDKEKVVAERVA